MLSNMAVFLCIFLFGYLLLNKKLCYVIGILSLATGVVLPVSLWTYAEFFVKGDKSFHGMMGTVVAFILIPSGLGLILMGFIKSK